MTPEYFTISGGSKSRKLTFIISDPTIEPAEYMFGYQTVRNLAKEWIQLEKSIYPESSISDSLVDSISKMYINKIAQTNDDYRNKIVNIFQDTKHNLSFCRLLDVIGRVERTLSTELFNLVQGKSYKGMICDIKGSGITNLPSQEDWYTFIEQFPFAWILPIIQEVIWYPKDSFQLPQ
jgi:hypothetical protein